LRDISFFRIGICYVIVMEGTELDHLQMKTALIIEQDPKVRLSFMRSLGRRGWWVDAVGSIESGLAMLQRSRRDLVLIDWHAEAGSGLLVLTLVKCDPACRCSLVIMTHHGFSEDLIEMAMLAGADGCLLKPTLTESRAPQLKTSVKNSSDSVSHLSGADWLESLPLRDE
jgi:DNA-binding response OmpR family regulator